MKLLFSLLFVVSCASSKEELMVEAPSLPASPSKLEELNKFHLIGVMTGVYSYSTRGSKEELIERQSLAVEEAKKICEDEGRKLEAGYYLTAKEEVNEKFHQLNFSCSRRSDYRALVVSAKKHEVKVVKTKKVVKKEITKKGKKDKKITKR